MRAAKARLRCAGLAAGLLLGLAIGPAPAQGLPERGDAAAGSGPAVWSPAGIEDVASAAITELAHATTEAARPMAQGLASWYGQRFHRRRTASGEPFDMHGFTAAHPNLPFGTWLCVRSQITGQSVRVRVNDRGPHMPNRIIDLSRSAAMALGLLERGTKPVELWPDDGRC